MIRVGVWGLELGYRGETVLRVTVESLGFMVMVTVRLQFKIRVR